MTRLLAAAALAILAFAPVVAQAQLKDLEAKLRSQYVRHLLVLRSAGAESELTFDDGGSPAARLTPVPLIDSGFYVSDVHLTSSELRLKGARLIFVGRNLDPILADADLTVRIAFRVPVSSIDQVHAAMPHVFLSTDEFNQLKSTYFVPLELFDAAKPGDAVATLRSEPVYKAGNGVSPPRAVRTPDPDYTQDARRKGFRGTTVLDVVVAADGEPAFIQIKQPLGHGLTEKAIEAVAKWKFAPAARAGSAVPALISVEVNFKLY